MLDACGNPIPNGSTVYVSAVFVEGDRNNYVQYTNPDGTIVKLGVTSADVWLNAPECA